MRLHLRVPWLTTPFALLFLPACEKSSTPAESVVDPSLEADVAEISGGRMPFADAEVFFELNTTDHDMGFQVFLDAEGWRRATLLDPDGVRVFGMRAEGRLAEIGITELRFESAEPSPAEVRSRFPAGEYTFRGETVEGVALESKVDLSQRMLPAPSFTPRNGQVVDRTNAVVRWDAPGAEQVEVIIESDELEDVLDVTLSGTTDRLTIPRQFLRRGREYKIEVLAIAENGNRTIAESTFRTEE